MVGIRYKRDLFLLEGGSVVCIMNGWLIEGTKGYGGFGKVVGIFGLFFLINVD